MANFGQLVLTNLGVQAQYNVQAGSELKFSRIAMGSGKFNGNVMGLTKLVKEDVSVNISKGYMQNNAYVLEGFFSNDGLTTGFEWREIGLFAKDKKGNEILYCYANAGDTYDYIPATEDERYSKYIRIATAIGNAENITFENSEEFLYVDLRSFNELSEDVDSLHPSKVVCDSCIPISDSAGLPFVRMNIYGKSEQKNVPGNQLLNYSAWKTAGISNGTAVFENNGIKLTATGDDCYTTYSADAFPAGARIPVSEGEVITMSWESNTDVQGAIYIFPEGNTADWVMTWNQSDNKLSYVVPSGVSFITFRFGVSQSGDTISYKNIMIVRGGNPIEWEPYVGELPSPNPMYPQEIVNVGGDGNINLTLYGKNLLKSLASPQTFNGITYSPYGNGGIIASGTSTSSAALVLEYKTPVLGGYVLSGSTANTRVVARVVYKDGTSVYHTSYNGSIVSFELTEDVREYNVYVEVKGNITVNNEIMYPLLRRKEFADDVYEAYKEPQRFSLSTPNGLPGIPVPSGGNYTDADGQQWVCDEIDFARGVRIQRINQMKLTGDEDISRSETSSWAEGCYVIYTANNNPNHINGELMCTFLPGHSNADLAADKYEYGIGTHGSPNIMVRFGADINNLDLVREAWKSAIASGGKVYSILEKPIETELTTAEIEAYRSLHTNLPNTTILADADVEVEYITESHDGAIGHIFKNFLPLTGGTLSGTLLTNGGYGFFESSKDYGTYIGSLKNPNNVSDGAFLIMSHSGLTDMAHAIGMQYSANGELKTATIFGEHNKDLMAESFLPLTGGTLSAVGKQIVFANGAGYVYQDGNSTGLTNCFGDPSNNSGYRCMSVRNKTYRDHVKDSLVYECKESGDSNTFEYLVFGEHNKPTGSYTGNGSATARTINIPCVGRVLYIVSANGSVIISHKGSIAWQKGVQYVLAFDEGYFNDGVLNIMTTNNLLNASGTTYHYQVL